MSVRSAIAEASLGILLAVSASFAVLPSCTLLQTDIPPLIDGILDEALWANLDTMMLVNSLDGSAAVQKTRAFAAWDSDNLYLAVAADDTDILASITARDGELYTEEALELFIDPDNDGENYFEFEWNARNAYMDIFMSKPWDVAGGGGDLDWNANTVEYAVSVEGSIGESGDRDEGICLEAKIPWSALSASGVSAPLPAAGETYALNIYRIDGNDANAQILSAWSPVGPSFHKPLLFGTCTLSDRIAGATHIAPIASRAPAGHVFKAQSSAGGIRFTGPADSHSSFSARIYSATGSCIADLGKPLSSGGMSSFFWDGNSGADDAALGMYWAVISNSAGVVEVLRVMRN